MPPDSDKSRLVELLRGAIGLAPAERAAFLDRECAGEPDLRADVERLLRHEAAARALLPTQLEDGSGSDTAVPDSLSGASSAGPRPEEWIGPYRLLEPLGEGGMGVVYLAEQRQPVRRRVALKLIKLGMDSREVIARFEAERQALALMQHPAIAQVYDAGATDDGRPYFVMEEVRGVPITEYCDRHKLPIRDRLELVAEVCRGVHHAHGRGVIHRDIKPGNVLVCCPDAKPIPKIIDFGVAKATNQRLTEKTLYSELGRVIGTPAYMSPEQAAASSERVDHRTDIYSLGVLLYELLVGELPLELSRAALHETIRVICEEDPPTPSSRWSRLNGERTSELAVRRGTTPAAHRRALREDLDWVTMKALEKERHRRYPTAADFADQIDLCLAGKPVTVGPPSVIYRARRFARKNRGAVTAAVAVFAALSIGLVASIHFARRLQEQLDEVMRLADVRRLADYEREAEQLWPASSANVPRLQEWTRRAEKLAARLEQHRRDLAAFEEEARARESGGTQDAGKRQTERQQTEPRSGDGGPALEFADAESAWRHETLSALVRDLEAFADPEVGTLADVGRRLDFATSVRERTLEGAAARAKWRDAIAQIRDPGACPTYGGLELGPQEGLLPLGRDPDSGLWEFAHLQTGLAALRGADGRLRITDETGLVFVLIPGGAFRMGAVRPTDERPLGSPNVDPQATSLEFPDHEVSLEPFFLSKYEMTQAQWRRFTSDNPSVYKAGKTYGGHEITRRDPVSNITHRASVETLFRLGLSLPTEAQWEYAARAGAGTVWWTGNSVESLDGAANIGDRYYKSHGAQAKDVYSPEIDDGHFAHAPVGSFRANGFGLHDVVGNVWEWCRDGFDRYLYPVREGDGLRESPETIGHVYRGGGFSLPAEYARSATRFNGVSGFADASVGVRPARGIDG